jgi:hypothetical protein
MTPAQLEVVANYGIGMKSFERDGRVQICYDGEAFRRVLALPQSNPQQRARAALALTRHECVSPDLTPMDRASVDAWRYEVLSRVDTSTLPGMLKNRIYMRRAGVLAAITYEQARRGESPQETASNALQSLAAINKTELTEDDAYSYNDAAVRVGAVRWAAENSLHAGSILSVATHAGQPGETCIQLVDATQKAPLFERCTYGIVWTASASANVQHTALALAVQTGESWRELWLFRKGADGWHVDVIPPSANLTTEGPGIGYIEFSGWVPGSQQILTTREMRSEGRYKRSFEILSMESLQVARWAEKPESLSAFYKWQDPQWKRTTISMR